MFFALVSCEEQREHTAPGIYPKDSVAVMTSYGVNTLVSDSGVIKYRIVAERWEINENKNPKIWIFDKGVFLTQFDQKFHIFSYIQCDTAYRYTEAKLWELRGRVRILTKDGLRFFSNQLFWDEGKHEIFSHVYSRLVTPERTMEGSYFTSDERMTRYFVSNTKGSFEKGDVMGGNSQETDSVKLSQDSTLKANRPQSTPQPKTIFR